MGTDWWSVLWICVGMLCSSEEILEAECPRNCRCNYNNTDSEVDCSHQNLYFVEKLAFQASTINYSHNSLSDLTFLNQPNNVVNLDLSFNQITEFPPHFSQSFSKLKVLNVSHNKIQTIPLQLPKALQVLRLSYNQIQILDMSSIITLNNLQSFFLDFNLIRKILPSSSPNILQSLNTVSFKSNKLDIIPDNFGKVFWNLTKLSFSNNSLMEIPSHLCEDLKAIELLDFSVNQIQEVRPNIFKKNENLKYLLLGFNKLKSMPSGLPMLEWLDVSYNDINKIPESQSSDVYPQEIFLFGGNPFHCDCDLIWLKEFFHTREYLKNIVSVSEEKFVPVCGYPEKLAGGRWDVLDDLAFGCEDYTESNSEKGKGDHIDLSWDAKNLHIRIKEIGDTFISLEWISSSEVTDVILFSYHQFGKQNKKKKIIHPHLERYKIRNLKENTPYVICISLISEEALISQVDVIISTDDCLEIITKEVPKSITNFYFLLIFSSICGGLCVCIFYFRLWETIYPEIEKVKSVNFNKNDQKSD